MHLLTATPIERSTQQASKVVARAVKAPVSRPPILVESPTEDRRWLVRGRLFRFLLAALLPVGPSWAWGPASPTQRRVTIRSAVPARTTWCGPPAQFHVGPAVVTVELRRSTGCEAGWGRISSSGNGPVKIIFSAWNPGGPSQYMINGTNWTTEMSAYPGQQVCAGFQAWDGSGRYIGWYFAGCATA